MKQFVSLVVTLFLLTTAARAADADPRAAEFFEAKVRPVLAEHCYACHGPEKQKGGLRLDSRSSMMEGGESGSVLAPGNPARSKLVEVVGYEGETKMPPKGKLPAEARAALAEWVRLGAPWPDGGKKIAEVKPGPTPAVSDHWAFRPVREPAVPAVKEPVASPLDAFVLARLEPKGLTFSPPAGRVTLIRRATFDLTGLPPTPEEIDAFLADDAPDAFAKVVDRLLSSPAYGERWGRHWLDVARYADSKGYVFTEERRFPYAYTYRDYVIKSLNDDKPYDRFVTEQLAADLLPLGEDKHPLAAMGFLTLGRRFLNNTHDIIDDRIDVVSRGLLGLTVSCARCHDHKFDPIPTQDYYSLYGVFAASVEPKDLPLLETPKRTPEVIAFEQELAKREAAVNDFLKQRQAELVAGLQSLALLPGDDPVALRGSLLLVPELAARFPPERLQRRFTVADRNRLVDLRKKVEAHKATSPAAPPRGMVLNDVPNPPPAHVLVRGNPANPGEAVPRRFLKVVAGEQRKPFAQGSGRLELARAITDPANPLTARVLVNRVWGWHFGKGLVTTPSDFGVRSDPPSHPELLDYLAARFVAEGWSLKALHRAIMLSQTYQQSSGDRADGLRLDPENRLLWRFNRQRLDFEAMRDGMLAVGGNLDRSLGGPAVDILKEPVVPRRSVYGFIDRQNVPGVFRTFDVASSDTHTPQRFTTTVPQQALFLMNSPFAQGQAQKLAARPDVAGGPTPEARIARLYRLLYGRMPSDEEVSLGVRFVGSPPAAGSKLTPWEEYAQVLVLANEFAFVD